MSEQRTAEIIERLALAFGAAIDVTPAGGQPSHVLLPQLELPEPWRPSPARALTIWADWPTERPQFYIDVAVTGETREPPRSHGSSYLLGETWRNFSFTFPWAGDDPVRAVQLWVTRFVKERS
jgi:hypothetical protein